MPHALSEQQRAFCVEYVKTGNATSAAKSAGYSAKTANVQGTQLLQKPLVAAEVARLRGHVEKKTALTVERVTKELEALAFVDPGSMFGSDGKLLGINEMPEETRRAISGFGDDKIKLSSKLGALELAAKLLGMVKQEQQHQASVQIVIASPERVIIDGQKPALQPDWDTVGST